MQNALPKQPELLPKNLLDSVSNYNNPSETVLLKFNYEQNRSFGLDFARMIAISLVLFAHFAHKSLNLCGYWGVELFFGLSGFLIGQILWKSFSQAGAWSLNHVFNFWVRRWWRTLPNYYLFFFLTLGFTYLIGESLPGLPVLSTFLWFGQDLTYGVYGFFTPSWSLCIEEWFYLLFPIVLFALSKTRLKPKASFIFTLSVFIIGSILLREIFASHKSARILRVTTFARLDSIAFGVLLAFITAIRKPSYKLRWLFFITGAILCLAPVITIFYGNTYEKMEESPFYLFIIPLGFSLMMPLVSLWQIPRNRVGIFSGIVQKISLWSYSIYLSHLLIMFAVYRLTSSIRDSNFGNLFSKIAGLAATLLVSALLYHFFEEPLTRKRPAALKK